MLDAFKKTISGQGPSRKAADELEDLLLKARVERAALTNTLSQVEMQASRLTDLEHRLGSAAGQAATAVAQIEKVTERLGQVETRLAVLSDADQRLKALKDGLKRFATGTYAVWYPMLPRQESRQLPDRLKRLSVTSWLHANLTVRDPTREGHGMHGSGMFVINPPWTLHATLKQTLPWLASALGEDGQGGYTLEREGK